MSLYNLENARGKEQLEQMVELEGAGTCVFCPEHFEHEHHHGVEFEADGWYVTKNDYPYAETDLHLLVIPKLHVRGFEELPRSVQQAFGLILTRCQAHWKLSYFGVGMRSGDFRYNGSTIEHLHAHIIVAKPEPAEKVRFAVGKAPR